MMGIEEIRLQALRLYVQLAGHLPVSAGDWVRLKEIEAYLKKGESPAFEPA